MVEAVEAAGAAAEEVAVEGEDEEEEEEEEASYPGANSRSSSSSSPGAWRRRWAIADTARTAGPTTSCAPRSATPPYGNRPCTACRGTRRSVRCRRRGGAGDAEAAESRERGAGEKAQQG